MKKNLSLILFAIGSLYSSQVFSQLSLNVKIDQVIEGKTIATSKTLSANYNQDIIIAHEGMQNRIVLKLKKFNDILVNGNKINPVQIDMKLINSMKNLVGKPQTITSFYAKSAQFSISSKGKVKESSDLNVSLHFEEI